MCLVFVINFIASFKLVLSLFEIVGMNVKLIWKRWTKVLNMVHIYRDFVSNIRLNTFWNCFLFSQKDSSVGICMQMLVAAVQSSYLCTATYKRNLCRRIESWIKLETVSMNNDKLRKPNKILVTLMTGLFLSNCSKPNKSNLFQLFKISNDLYEIPHTSLLSLVAL